MSKIAKGTAEKYIKGYFCFKYPISEEKQPHFWDAVILLCEDINADVSSLINENQPMCYYTHGEYFSIYSTKIDLKVDSLNQLAHIIASEIIEADSMPIEKADVFVLQKKFEWLSERFEILSTYRRGL